MRIGETILLIDSDTVVPEDCLRDAAREMMGCGQPSSSSGGGGARRKDSMGKKRGKVTELQHESDVMQVFREWNCIFYEDQ